MWSFITQAACFAAGWTSLVHGTGNFDARLSDCTVGNRDFLPRPTQKWSRNNGTVWTTCANMNATSHVSSWKMAQIQLLPAGFGKLWKVLCRPEGYRPLTAWADFDTKIGIVGAQTYVTFDWDNVFQSVCSYIKKRSSAISWHDFENVPSFFNPRTSDFCEKAVLVKRISPKNHNWAWVTAYSQNTFSMLAEIF